MSYLDENPHEAKNAAYYRRQLKETEKKLADCGTEIINLNYKLIDTEKKLEAAEARAAMLEKAFPLADVLYAKDARIKELEDDIDCFKQEVALSDEATEARIKELEIELWASEALKEWK